MNPQALIFAIVLYFYSTCDYFWSSGSSLANRVSTNITSIFTCISSGCESTLDECQVDELYPITIPSGPYTANFHSLSSSQRYVILRDDKPYITSFNIEGLVHSGGTIAYKISPFTVSKLMGFFSTQNC